MTNKQQGLGIWIVIAGVVILLGKLGVFSFIGTVFWPLFILIPGIVLQFLYFSRVLSAGILIPAGILTTYGVVFLIGNIFGWESMKYLWPLFIFGVAVGLYEYYVFSVDRPRPAYVASLILTLITVVFLALTLLWTIGIYFIALGLIIVGLVLVFGGRKRPW